MYLGTDIANLQTLSGEPCVPDFLCKEKREENLFGERLTEIVMLCECNIFLLVK